jgi:hypothetical protein
MATAHGQSFGAAGKSSERLFGFLLSPHGNSRLVKSKKRRVSEFDAFPSRAIGAIRRPPKGRNETGVWWHRHDKYKG